MAQGKKNRLNKYLSLSPFFFELEMDSQRVFEEFVKQGDVVFDLGANTGIHSMPLFSYELFHPQHAILLSFRDFVSTQTHRLRSII